VGLLCLGLVALSLVRGDLGLADAGVRAGVVFAVLVGLDRFVLPLLASTITRKG
jgi:hypothetical protein